MTEAKFCEIWNVAIKPYLKRELSLDSSLQSLDVTENGSKARRDLESLYDTARNDIKRNYMKDCEKLIDRHKIPACIYCAMVGAPLLKVFGGSAEKDRLANAKLAFYASSSLLLSFMSSGADAEYSRHLSKNGLQFPQGKNLDSGESYLTQTLKELCYAQRRKELNPLMLANVFFMIEAYNDSVYRSS